STGQYLIVSVDLPLEAHVSEATPEAPFLGMGFTLRAEAIASLLLETGTAQSTTPDTLGIAVSTLTDDLVDPLGRLLRLTGCPADIAVLAGPIEREILGRLSNGARGGIVREIGFADGRMAPIGRAVGWIREHYAEAVRIGDLARVAGMSMSSFHRHFQAVASM